MESWSELETKMLDGAGGGSLQARGFRGSPGWNPGLTLGKKRSLPRAKKKRGKLTPMVLGWSRSYSKRGLHENSNQGLAIRREESKRVPAIVTSIEKPGSGGTPGTQRGVPGVWGVGSERECASRCGSSCKPTRTRSKFSEPKP